MERKRCYIWDLSKDEIQQRVNKCFSISDVLNEFGYSRSNGSMHSVIKKIIIEYGIDTSHFYTLSRVGQPHQYSLDEILVNNSTYANIGKLKERLLRDNLLEYKCAFCGNTGEWNGKKLVLQLDHIDGNHFNHTLENLRFLCPNCHSQTETYSGKNNRKKVMDNKDDQV